MLKADPARWPCLYCFWDCSRKNFSSFRSSLSLSGLFLGAAVAPAATKTNEMTARMEAARKVRMIPPPATGCGRWTGSVGRWRGAVELERNTVYCQGHPEDASCG